MTNSPRWQAVGRARAAGMLERDPWQHSDVAELRRLAKEHHLRGYSKLRRDELIAVLEAADVKPLPLEDIVLEVQARFTPQRESMEELRKPSPETEARMRELRRAGRHDSQKATRVSEGVYVSATGRKRVEVTLVNPDTRRWQVRFEGLLYEDKVREFDDQQLGQVVGLAFGPKQVAKAYALMKVIRRDYPAE